MAGPARFGQPGLFCDADSPLINGFLDEAVGQDPDEEESVDDAPGELGGPDVRAVFASAGRE